MLSATGSTGRRKGAASLSFFRLRMVDWQKRSWAVVKVEGPVEEDEWGGTDEGGREDGGAAAVAALEGGTGLGAAEAGGGVADFRRTNKNRESARPLRRTEDTEALTFKCVKDALSASECILARFAGGGLCSSSSGCESGRGVDAPLVSIRPTDASAAAGEVGG